MIWIFGLFTFYFYFTRFSSSCAASACACGQTGNHSDSGLIENKLKLKPKYRQTPAQISPNAVRSIKNDTVAIFNEHKLQAARIKIPAYTPAASVGAEPIYVNRMQNQSNYNNINSHVNGTQSERDYYNVMVENGDIAKFEAIINGSRVKTNKLIGKPPLGEKHLRSFFGLSLDEREMPITRERSKLLQTGGSSNSSKRPNFGSDTKKSNKSIGSPKLLRASTYDAYPSRAKNR